MSETEERLRHDRDYFKTAYLRKLDDEAKALAIAQRLESELREARQRGDDFKDDFLAAEKELREERQRAHAAESALSAERTARVEAERDRAQARRHHEQREATLQSRVSGLTIARQRMREALEGVCDPNAEPWQQLREVLKLLLMALTERETEEAEMRVRELLVLLAGAPELIRVRAALAAEPGEGPAALEGHPRAAEVKNEG